MTKGKRKITIAASIATVFVLLIVTALIPMLRSQFSIQAMPAAGIESNERVVIAIEGMHCTACASGIKSMLKRTSGVVSAEVSFEKKEADVEFRPSETTRGK